MRRFSILVFILFSLYAQAQTVPQGINYQAVALDQRGQPIPGIDIVGRPIDDAEIGVRITILENSTTGNILYQEEHEVRTDLYGMFELVIGQGLQVSADPFSAINWQGDKFLQVELSIDNDGEFLLSAVQQLMSVPYAFLAENAMVAQTAVDVDDSDADPSNELQSLSVSGNSLTLSNGNTVQLPAIDDADADPNNEIQVLSRSNDTLYLSNGGYAVLPVDQINDADADPSNEIQTLSKSGSTISLTNGGNVSVFDGDYSSLSNTPSIPSNTSDLTNDSGFLTSEVDGSTSNELQLLSISNDTIYLSDGGFVKLPSSSSSSASSSSNNEINSVYSFPTNNIDTGAFYYNISSDEMAVFTYVANSTAISRSGIYASSVNEGLHSRSLTTYSFASFKASEDFFLTKWEFTGGGGGNFSYIIIKDSDWNPLNGDLGTSLTAHGSGTTINPMLLIQKDYIYHIGIRAVSSSNSSVPLTFITNGFSTSFNQIAEFQRAGVTGKFWKSTFTFRTYGYGWRKI